MSKKLLIVLGSLFLVVGIGYASHLLIGGFLGNIFSLVSSVNPLVFLAQISSSLTTTPTDTLFVLPNKDIGRAVFSVKNDGRVDIGSGSPNEQLTIEGAVSIAETNQTPTTTSGYGKLYIKPGFGVDGNTKLLLHLNENGTDAFTDSSSASHAVQVNGNVTIDPSQIKFGSGSGLFLRASDYLSIADRPSFDLTQDDFTIDAWINFNNLSSNDSPNHPIVTLGNLSPGACSKPGWYFGYDQKKGKLLFGDQPNGSIYGANWNPKPNIWYHVAVSREDSTYYLFVNGTEIPGSGDPIIGTGALPIPLDDMGNPLISSEAAKKEQQPLEIGVFDQNCKPQFFFNGHITELRISKGIARWNSDFIPPTQPYDYGGLFYKNSSGEETLIAQ